MKNRISIVTERTRELKEIHAGEKYIHEQYEFHRLMEIEHARLKIKYGRHLFGKTGEPDYCWEGMDEK